MGPLVVVLLGAIAVFWYLGLLTPERLRIIGGIGLALIGLFVTLRGAPLAGVPVAGLGSYFLWRGLKRPSPAGMTVERAAALLHVSPTASESEIRKAYRLAVAAAHPDRGGSHEKTSELNEARTVLLAAKQPKIP